MTKDDRVRDLHHGRLQVDREQNAGFHAVDFGLDEVAQRRGRHKGRVDNGAFFVAQPVFQNGLGAIGGGKDDFRATGLSGGDGGRFFVGKEIVAGHRGDGGLAVCGPFTHRVRVGLGIFLDGLGGAAVRVAFAQDGVHSRPFDRVVTGADVFFLIRCGIGGVGGDGKALRLQFLDRGGQLRHRGRHVRQLDDVGIGRFHQIAQFGQIVRDTLIFVQVIGEGRQDTGRNRNVARCDVDIGSRSKRADDRQQRGAGQFGGFVNNGVNDIGCLCHSYDVRHLRDQNAIGPRAGNGADRTQKRNVRRCVYLRVSPSGRAGPSQCVQLYAMKVSGDFPCGIASLGC